MEAESLPEIKAGWPEEIYHHTGEWMPFQDGYYKAARNRNEYWLPEYVSNTGKVIYPISLKADHRPLS